METERPTETPEDPAEERGRLVIGAPLAAARRAEERRLTQDEIGPSPLGEARYDFWRSDLNLVDPAPSSLDVPLRDLCRDYAGRSAAERAGIRDAIDMEGFYTLMTFARRSAVFALRQADAALVGDALAAIAMIDRDRVDFRDVLVCAALVHHAARRLDADAASLFADAIRRSEPGTASLLTGFMEQSPEHHDLETSWGYTEIDTGAGPGLIGWGRKPYAPTRDLARVAIEIVRLVDEDYHADSIELATELPAVWLRTDDPDEVERVLTSCRGVAKANAQLRPERSPDHQAQQFTAFVLETVREADARLLLRRSRESKVVPHATLAETAAGLLCLIVAHSWVQGVESYETSERLTRFAAGLRSILERQIHGATTSKPKET